MLGFNFGKGAPAELRGATIKDLLSTPTGSAAAKELVSRRLEERVALRKRFDQAQLDHKAVKAAQQKIEDADRALEAARAALKKAQSEQMRAHSEFIALTSGPAMQRARLRAELIESADPRIGEFIWHVNDLLERSRFLGASAPVVHPTGGGPRIVSNIDELNGIREKLTRTRERLIELQIEALSPAEIRARLEGFVRDLAPGLREFSLAVPQVGDEEVTILHRSDRPDMVDGKYVPDPGLKGWQERAKAQQQIEER
jgi:hypothetical protein